MYMCTPKILDINKVLNNFFTQQTVGCSKFTNTRTGPAWIVPWFKRKGIVSRHIVCLVWGLKHLPNF